MNTNNLTLLPYFIFIGVLIAVFYSFVYSSVQDLNNKISNKSIKKQYIHKSNVLFFMIAIFLMLSFLYIFFNIPIKF